MGEDLDLGVCMKFLTKLARIPFMVQVLTAHLFVLGIPKAESCEILPI